MKYTVQITETLSRRVTVDADSFEEARQKVNDDYYDCKIVLTSDDYVDGSVQFETLGTVLRWELPKGED